MRYYSKEIVEYLCGGNPLRGITHLEAHLLDTVVLPKGVSQVKFPVIESDRDGNYDPETGRFNAKATRTYQVSVCALFEDIPIGQRFWIGIYKNGGAFAVDTKNGGAQASQVTRSLWLNAGDYLEVYAYCDGGARLNPTNYATWLTVT